MIIGINASFLRKQNTGIGQVTANFLKKLAEVSADENEYILYLEEDVDVDFEFLDNGVSSVAKFRKNVFLPKYKRDDLIRKIWWEKFLLPKKVREDECDVLFSPYQSPTVLRNMLRNKKNILHIMMVHDIIPKLFPQYLSNWRKKIYQKLMEGAIKKADKIIAVSHRTEKDLIQHLEIDAHKIVVSYIDIDEIYKQEVSDQENQRVMNKYVLKPGYIYSGGGLEVRKNTESVLRAYKILLEAYGHASWLPKLVISGKLMPELAPLITDVTATVEGLDIKKETAVLDFVPQEDLPALYRNAKLFIYPSFYEGFGLPILEAMSQAVPTITAKTSSLPEVGSDSVLYCDPTDVDELARMMKKVLMDEHMRKTLSAKGKERSTHFSWEKFVEKFLNIVRSTTI